MHRFILQIMILILVLHCYCLSQWVMQNSPVTSGLYDMQFIDINTGWICGTNSTILKTTNGGINWVQQVSPISGRELNAIQMIDLNSGYIVGWTNTVLKTTNGGINWNQITGPFSSSGSLNDLSFINYNTGWTCAFQGVIWKTTNGGVSWDSLNSGGAGPMRNVQFLNSQTGWIAGDVGFIRKTTDGGINWLFQFQGSNADYWYNAMHFININTGWLVGRNNRIFRTTNSGNQWDTISLITGGAVIRFANVSTGWCGGSLSVSNQSVMYKTTNSGLNWIEQNILSTFGFCGSIWCVNDTTVWSTFGNKILHTTNGGTYVAVEPISNVLPIEYNLLQNYPNPFNPFTIIEFEVPVEDNVKLTVFDILGREFKRIFDGKLKAGKYKAQFNSENLSSGIYFYTLNHSQGKITKKMILNK